jgi:hypothetical protein
MKAQPLEMALPPSAGVGSFRPDRILFLAGILQIVATFTPAARMRVLGGVSFVRLPTAGATLVILGLLTLVIALRPNRWWRWIPGILSSAILAIVYLRLKRNPSHTLVDPLLRHLLHPSWGFVPMGIAVLLSIFGAARVHPRASRDRHNEIEGQPLDSVLKHHSTIQRGR